jgi:hypothetical protein
MNATLPLRLVDVSQTREPALAGDPEHAEEPTNAVDDDPIDLMAFMPLVKSIAYRIFTSIPCSASVGNGESVQPLR